MDLSIVYVILYGIYVIYTVHHRRASVATTKSKRARHGLIFKIGCV